MTDKLDVRLDGRSVDLEPLDITSYLSAPNLINTCKSHLGTIFHYTEQFFKPKELFCVMEDNQANEDAEKLSQSFDIENSTVRSIDANALQAPISYVKRLLQLFPGVQESTKRALSSDGVRNRVCQFETRRYVERISQSPLEFNVDSLCFTEFIEREQQKVYHLQMVIGDEWTGLIKAYEVLQKTGCLSEGQ
jgi:hypothetical protein